jgi:hypothetical protein
MRAAISADAMVPGSMAVRGCSRPVKIPYLRVNLALRCGFRVAFHDELGHG